MQLRQLGSLVALGLTMAWRVSGVRAPEMEVLLGLIIIVSFSSKMLWRLMAFTQESGNGRRFSPAVLQKCVGKQLLPAKLLHGACRQQVQAGLRRTISRPPLSAGGEFA
jgi:hypothetical protein